jgi:hypothetical protein
MLFTFPCYLFTKKITCSLVEIYLFLNTFTEGGTYTRAVWWKSKK